MMRSVANFLLHKPDDDMKHLARLFVNEFFKQPGRGYGENVAEESTKITHTNLLGINGALLQCLAIHQAFQADSFRPVDVQSFFADEDQSETPFCSKLKQMQSLLKKKPSDDLDEEVIYILGNGISAYESVATAIYCFLRAQTDTPFYSHRRCLQMAVFIIKFMRAVIDFFTEQRYTNFAIQSYNR
ncbi:hypothetical protein YQE_00506, partial [Dendroctonus ponderosae]